MRRICVLCFAVVAAALVAGCGDTSEMPRGKVVEQPTDQRVAATPAQSQTIVDSAQAILEACAAQSGEAAIAPHVTLLVQTVNAVRIDSPMALDNYAVTPRSEVARLITPLGQCAPAQALALERGTGIEPE